MPSFIITWTESKTLESEITADTEEEALSNFEFEGNYALNYNPDTIKYWMSEAELEEIQDLEEEA